MTTRSRIGEGLTQLRIGTRYGLPPRHQRFACTALPYIVEDRLARQAVRPLQQRHSASALAHRFIRRPQAASALIQVWPDRTQLAFQLGKRSLHAQAV